MTTNPTTTIGCDLGDRSSHLCVLGPDGDVTLQCTVPTNRAAFEAWFSQRPACRLAAR